MILRAATPTERGWLTRPWRASGPRVEPVRQARGAARLAALAGVVLFAATSGACRPPVTERTLKPSPQWNSVRAHVKARLAEDQLNAGHVAAAAAEIAQAVRLDPEHPGLRLLEARVCLADGRTAQARRVLEALRSADDAPAEAFYLLGVLAQQRQEWRTALLEFQRAADRDGDQIAYLLAAVQTLQQMDDAHGALVLLSSRRDAFGATPGFWSAAAECHEQLGQWSDAARAWRKVLGAAPDDAGVVERLALALHRAGDVRAATPLLLERATAGQPGDGAHVRAALADCLIEARRYAEAEEILADALRSDPRDSAAMRLLARAYAEQGRFEEALDAARAALDVDEDDGASLELAAAVAMRAGQPALAGAFATRLGAVDPEARRVAERILAATTAATSR